MPVFADRDASQTELPVFSFSGDGHIPGFWRIGMERP